MPHQGQSKGGQVNQVGKGPLAQEVWMCVDSGYISKVQWFGIDEASPKASCVSSLASSAVM